MITEQDLQEAIAECEGQRNPTSSTCLKLAAFYTIRDKMYPADREVVTERPSYSYSMPPNPPEAVSGTEFLQVASTMDRAELLVVMDELMNTVKVLMPKLYDGVMRKMSQS